MNPYVYISTPTLGRPAADYMLSVLKALPVLGRAGLQPGFEMVVGVSPLHLARNQGVARFLKTSFTHLLFIDDDMVFTGEDILALVNANKPIIGAMVPQRSEHPRAFTANPKVNAKTDGHCIEVAEVGGGFMLIERSTLETICSAFNGRPFESFYDKGQDWSEDYGFCRHARKLDFEVWVHTGPSIGHVGEKVYRLNTEPEQRFEMLLKGFQ